MSLPNYPPNSGISLNLKDRHEES